VACFLNLENIPLNLSEYYLNHFLIGDYCDHTATAALISFIKYRTGMIGSSFILRFSQPLLSMLLIQHDFEGKVKSG